MAESISPLSIYVLAAHEEVLLTVGIDTLNFLILVWGDSHTAQYSSTKSYFISRACDETQFIPARFSYHDAF